MEPAKPRRLQHRCGGADARDSGRDDPQLGGALRDDRPERSPGTPPLLARSRGAAALHRGAGRRTGSRRPMRTGCWPNTARPASPGRTTAQAPGTRLLVWSPNAIPSRRTAAVFLRTEGYDVTWRSGPARRGAVARESTPARDRGADDLRRLGAELCRRLKQHECASRARGLRSRGSRRGTSGGRDASCKARRPARARLDPSRTCSERAAGRALPTTWDADGRARIERRRGPRPRPRRRPPGQRHRPDHGPTRRRKDDPRPAVHVRRRDRGRPADVPLDGLGAVQKILRCAPTLRFFDRDAIGRCVFYEDLGEVVADERRATAVTERIIALIKERRPGSSQSTASRRWPRSRTTRRNISSSCTASPPCSPRFPRPVFGYGDPAEEEARARRLNSPSPTDP